MSEKSTILRTISNVNQSLQCIEFANGGKQTSGMCYYEEDMVITIYLSNYNAKSKYEFQLEGGHSCCERYGMQVNDNVIYDSFKDYDIVNLDKDVQPFISDEVDKILIKQKSDGLDKYSISIEIVFTSIDESVRSLTIELFNEHNGYYSHTVNCYLTENNDSQSMQFLTTCL
jgi:hypothetical protein